MEDKNARKIKDFYETELGKIVQGNIASFIKEIWPSAENHLAQHQTILGFGNAAPYLSVFNKNNLIFNLIINEHLSTKSRGEISLDAEAKIPLAEDSIDKVIVIHCLEFQEDFENILKEIWHVLKPSGKVIFIIPNKNSLWSKLNFSPFFQGKSFSHIKIQKSISEYMFSILQIESTLHFFPNLYKIFPRILIKTDKISSKFCLGGVILLEAEKRLISSVPDFKPQRTSKYILER